MRWTILWAALFALGGTAMADQNAPGLDALFERLAGAASHEEAAPVEGAIWQAWLDLDDPETVPWVARGLRALNEGQLDVALAAFDRVVALAPDYAEGWNKRATVHWLRGSLEASVADIDRTLALEPRHFGALSGLALIREAQGRPFEALEALERVLRLHPRMPHLERRIEALTAQLGEAI